MRYRYLTTAQVAKCYAVTISYVRKLAHENQWRRRREGQSVAFLIDDVEAWNEARTRYNETKRPRDGGNRPRP